MVSKMSSSDVKTPDINREPLSDHDLIRGLILALGAGGRKPKTFIIYEDSIQALSEFARSRGLPGPASMDRTHILRWLTSLHQKGNKPLALNGLRMMLERRFKYAGVRFRGATSRSVLATDVSHRVSPALVDRL